MSTVLAATGPAFQSLLSLAHLAPLYLKMREEHPDVPAAKILAYLRDDTGESFEVFMCPGHVWAEGESDRGDEGPIYCVHCGADGDA